MRDQRPNKTLDTIVWPSAPRVAQIIVAAVLLMPLLAFAYDPGADAGAKRSRAVVSRQSEPAQTEAYVGGGCRDFRYRAACPLDSKEHAHGPGLHDQQWLSAGEAMAGGRP